MVRREQVQVWSVPVTGVVLGVAGLVAFGIGGDWWGGVGTLVVMLAYVGVLLLGRRFESLAVLGGQGIDERRQAISERAAAWTGYVLMGVAVVATFWNAARGEDVQPWASVAEIGGITFIVSVVVLRRRQ